MKKIIDTIKTKTQTDEFKDYVANHFANILLFSIAFIIFIVSLFIEKGMFHKLLPLGFFLMCIGFGYCINLEHFEYLNKNKKRIHYALMFLATLFDIITIILLLNNIACIPVIYILLSLHLIFISFFICNIIFSFVYSIVTKEKLRIFKGNVVYTIIYIIYLLGNTFLIPIFFII